LNSSNQGNIIMSEDTLMEFPHDYPLKVMGRNTDDFRSVVIGITQKHMGWIDASRIEERPSRDGTYLGLTVMVTATSKAQLDALYMELTGCERVLVAL
jgi:putative lipoic acid-binding regulatory protein